LNLSSHALIYLLLPLNLQSDNLCCFSFVLANDRGESFSALFSGSMLQTLAVLQEEVESNAAFHRSKRMQFQETITFAEGVYFSPLKCFCHGVNKLRRSWWEGLKVEGCRS
jgi:hypothetical protein